MLQKDVYLDFSDLDILLQAQIKKENVSILRFFVINMTLMVIVRNGPRTDEHFLDTYFHHHLLCAVSFTV